MENNKTILNKNKRAKIEIEIGSCFQIFGVDKVVESSDRKIILKVMGNNLILDGEKLEITNIDPVTNSLKGTGSITKYRYIKNKLLKMLCI